MQSARAQKQNRRRHARFPLGLPVRLQVTNRPEPIIVEIVDISAGGLRLRSLGEEVHLAQRATLRFVLPDQRACAVEGHVSRVERGGEFVLELEKANATFLKFLKSLAAEAL
jgi:c-di-GMP-binding flagellar brake protein YcgR